MLELKIEVIADNVKIFVNGKHFVEFKDSSHLYGSPMLMVTKNNQIRFSDIKMKQTFHTSKKRVNIKTRFFV